MTTTYYGVNGVLRTTNLVKNSTWNLGSTTSRIRKQDLQLPGSTSGARTYNLQDLQAGPTTSRIYKRGAPSRPTGAT